MEPSGITFEVVPGESIMAAANRAGYYWPTVCAGQGTCKACFVRVIEGGDGLPVPSRLEVSALRTLTAAQPDAIIRLACQLRPDADVVVWKPGVHL